MHGPARISSVPNIPLQSPAIQPAPAARWEIRTGGIARGGADGTFIPVELLRRDGRVSPSAPRGVTCVLWRYVSHLRWRKNKFIQRVLAFLCKISLYPNWQNKIGQYSLLEDFQGNICMRRLNNFIRWSNIVYPRDQEKMGINMGDMVNDRKAGIPTSVHTEVKKSIVQSLKGTLQRNVFAPVLGATTTV
ncbi:uncharacterized protein LOC133884121 [Phragmites australis]|uniref:uncharacterized protein LOC133884121 n=1 Tax=Phragmites australis TaxID=29695 RepID=UPI002D79D6E7|nr:uncharacterized protein LOC133884121 [Phragmites australis]